MIRRELLSLLPGVMAALLGCAGDQPGNGRQGAPAIPATSGSTRKHVRTGIEVLMDERLDLIRGKRLGLVTNHSGVDGQGRRTIDLLYANRESRLVALFSPEHGIGGIAAAGERVGSAREPRTGLPVFSLYGETTHPTAEMLKGVDTLVYDIQDVGARVYTYISTLAEVLRAGAEHGIPVLILDRPNPINGVDVEGNLLDPRFTSFVGPAPIPMRYGMTIGELGRFFNGELGIRADLTVVPMDGWRRSDWYDQTGLPWINPSPNIRSLAAATLYPGTVLFEGTNLSEGRGTDRPFEWCGAPWIDGSPWADRLNQADLPGVRTHPMHFTPASSKHVGEQCQGVLVEITDRAQVQPMALGLSMLAAARELSPDRLQFRSASFDRLAGTDEIRQALEQGRPVPQIMQKWQVDLERFASTRARYLLY